MQFYTAIVVIGIVAVSAIESDLKKLPMKLIANLDQELLPLVDASNNLSTDGYVAFPGQFPYHARLSIKNGVDSGSTLSAGSLITSNYILTQARDLRNNINYAGMHGYAVLGIDDGIDAATQQQINFTKSGVQFHPLHDLATVRLEHPVTITKFVQPIRLPRLSDSRTYEMMEGTNVGFLFGPLKYLRNQVMSNDNCNQQHPYAYVDAYNICTNTYVGGAFCNSVYGSGLVVEDEKGPILVGVATLIYWCSVNYPTIYVRVSEFHDWISMNSDYVFDL